MRHFVAHGCQFVFFPSFLFGISDKQIPFVLFSTNDCFVLFVFM